MPRTSMPPWHHLVCATYYPWPARYVMSILRLVCSTDLNYLGTSPGCES